MAKDTLATAVIIMAAADAAAVITKSLKADYLIRFFYYP